MTPDQIEEHNGAFEQAAQLIEGEIITQGHQPTSGATASVRSKLERALQLLARVLELNPANWSAMWLAGKIHQRLGNQSKAFALFVQAYQINQSQPDVAREASLCAMALGRSEEAIHYAQVAFQSQPSNNGLQANLALAFLLAGRLDEAKISIEKVTARSSADAVSKTVRSMIDHLIAAGEKPPNTTAALEDHWRKMRQPA
jgi:Flp pilus assembly protein TadD